MRARLYAINYGTELFAADTSIDQAVGFAQTGVKLDPANQRTRGALAFVLMLANEVAAARAEADRTLALNPESLIFLDNIGYLLTLLGDWRQGPALIKKAIDINPYYNAVVHHALWLDLFRREEYPRAYLETLNFRMPTLFWEHLAKAATLGQLGRICKGRQAAEELLTLKADFARRGRLLIGRFVKFEVIVERLIVGLSRVGIEVD
jgi:tetratricopeptide (TPR) repeat protein